MTVVSITTSKSANLQAASSCSKNEAGLQVNFSVMRAVRAFWPKKYKDALSSHTRASDRMIQYWLANKYSISASDLAHLIRSDAGFLILENLMGEAKPAWWQGFKRGVRRSELRRQQKALQEAIEENEQGDFGL
jgi:hypothetical protein